MEYAVIAIASLLASGLTLFSGFGLGTILTPVFALFFPLEIAVGMTAVVHLLNNLYKLSLLGKFVDRSVLLRFGLPAIPAAIVGAWLLQRLSGFEEICRYSIGEGSFAVTPLKFGFSVLLLIFAAVEIFPLREMSPKFLPVGGLLSGFFGGLSGHQGALRSAFLARALSSRDAFLGTGIAVACIVDLLRVPFYAAEFSWGSLARSWPLLATAVLAALLGARIAAEIAPKVSMKAIRGIVAAGLFVLAVGLGAGWI